MSYLIEHHLCSLYSNWAFIGPDEHVTYSFNVTLPVKGRSRIMTLFFPSFSGFQMTSLIFYKTGNPNQWQPPTSAKKTE